MPKVYALNLKSKEDMPAGSGGKKVGPKKEVLNNILQFSRSYEVLKTKTTKLGVVLN